MIGNAEINVTAEDKQNVIKCSPGIIEDDELSAQMLQLEFNREHDKCNINQKNKSVQLPKIDNQERLLNLDSESDVDEEEINIQMKCDIFERTIPLISPRQSKKITKYTLAKNRMKDSYKVPKFPSRLQISAKKIVSQNYNNFNIEAKPKLTKQRESEEDSLIRESKINKYEQIVLYKLIKSKVLKKVNKIISYGKMAVIFHAACNPLSRPTTKQLPRECIIKVFRAKQPHEETLRKVILSWGEKEESILRRLENTAVHCPQFITRKRHIVVMSFIGEQQKPAPKLKDLDFTADEFVIVYKKVTEAMKAMYEEANLAHGYLSENNIFWYNNMCYFTDFHLSLAGNHECAFCYIYRDCCTISTFFQLREVPNIFTDDELFKYVTGCNYYNTSSWQ